MLRWAFSDHEFLLLYDNGPWPIQQLNISDRFLAFLKGAEIIIDYYAPIWSGMQFSILLHWSKFKQVLAIAPFKSRKLKTIIMGNLAESQSDYNWQQIFKKKLFHFFHGAHFLYIFRNICFLFYLRIGEWVFFSSTLIPFILLIFSWFQQSFSFIFY